MLDLLRKHKGKAILSSLVILLPMMAGLLLWERLPNSMPIHWGADGVADNFGYKGLMVLGMPLIHLALHWVALLITLADPKFRDQGKQAVNMVFWICPGISLFVCALQYSLALNWQFDNQMWLLLFLGCTFILMGNYMPKLKQNSTLGIKVHWALRNEENWAQTHRFTGKLYVLTGFLMLFGIFLPMDWIMPLLLLDILVVSAGPALYSYLYYRKQVKNGTFAQRETEVPKLWRKTGIAGTVIGIVILVFCIAMMFTGNIRFTVGDTALTIDADYYDDLTVSYGKIDSIEYRETYDVGYRTSGFGSPRLCLGIFTNEEFGRYTLYAYTGTESCIVLRSGSYVLVITDQTAEATAALYHDLVSKIPEN